MNYLSDPYGCIIDMEAGVTEDGIVIGTGPYVVTDLLTDDHLNLVKNENYWDGEPNIDEITVRTISDGDTLALALQSGEIQAAYGMPTQAIRCSRMITIPFQVLQQAVHFTHG